jgi:hypothetical protein
MLLLGCKKIKYLTIAERVNQFPKIIERYPQEFDVKFSSLASSHSDYDRQLTKQKFVIQKDHPAKLIQVADVVEDGVLIPGSLNYRIYAVKKCRHCLTVWNRDINAARNILGIFLSLRDKVDFGSAIPSTYF